ncbi:MAG: pyruvate kinase alpha/beta domain-containing protein [bacterium]
MKKQPEVRTEVTWFPRPGRACTARTLELALARGRALGLRHCVVASTTGATALRLARLLRDGEKAVCVTHHVGFREPGRSELSAAIERRLAALGVPVLRTTHALSGVERAARLRFGGLGPAETVAWTYRTFGEGTKVAVEVAVMALDAGLVAHGPEILAIGGTGRGADTALVIRPAHSRQFFDTSVREVVCKPRVRDSD